MKFADNEGFLKTGFTEGFIKELNKLAYKNELFDTVHQMFKEMNPCVKCAKRNVRHPLVEECLSCKDICPKYVDNKDLKGLLEKCQERKLTLDYNKDSFISTLENVLESLPSDPKIKKENIKKQLEEIFDNVGKLQREERNKGWNINERELGMPIVTQLCLSKDLLSLINSGVVSGVDITKFRGASLEQKIELSSNIYLTNLGIIISENDEEVRDLISMYHALSYSDDNGKTCENDMASYLAVRSQDWYLFKHSDYNKNQILAQWKGKNSTFEGEPELYVLLYKEFEEELKNIASELNIDLEEGNPFQHPDIKTKISEWRKSRHLGVEKFKEIWSKFNLYIKRIIPEMKSRLQFKVRKSKSPFQEAIFRSYSNNIIYRELIRGLTEDDNYFNIVLNGYQEEDRIRYVVAFKSVLGEDKDLKNSEKSFFFYIAPSIDAEKETDMSKDKPFMINISHASYVLPEWSQELTLDPNLYERVRYKEIEGPKYDDKINEPNKIYISTPLEYPLFDKSHEEIAEELKKTILFKNLNFSGKDVIKNKKSVFSHLIFLNHLGLLCGGRFERTKNSQKGCP